MNGIFGSERTTECMNEFLKVFFKITVDEDAKFYCVELSYEMESLSSVGEAIPPPISEVSEAGFRGSLVAAATSRGLASPLTLQKHLWPVIIRGRSVVCVSKRNSGKTIGYLLPVMSCVIETVEEAKMNGEYGPIALILVSSPQAAQRVGMICTTLLSSISSVKCVVLHSEASERSVYSQLLNGCSILVATPVAFLKALLLPVQHQYTFTNLRRLSHLVIDEGEQLLSKDQEYITKILAEINGALLERQDQSTQFVVVASEWTAAVDEFYQGLAPYQPILVKGKEEKGTQ